MTHQLFSSLIYMVTCICPVFHSWFKFLQLTVSLGFFYTIRSNNDSFAGFASQIWTVIIRTNHENNDTSTPHWGAIAWRHIDVMVSLITGISTVDLSSKIKHRRFALLIHRECNPLVTTKNQLCRKRFHVLTSSITSAITHHHIIKAIPCLNEPETTNTQ